MRAHGLRRSRYRGQRKTHLQHLATAAAINLARLDGWLRQRPTAADAPLALRRPAGVVRQQDP